MRIMPPLALSMSKMTPLVGQPFGIRLAFYGLRFLAWSNGLEAFMACVALAYAMGFVIFGAHPAFADMYPLAQQVAWVLLASGSVGIVALNTNTRVLRIASSLVAFMAWGLIAIGALSGTVDLQQRMALVLGTFALGELAIFVRLHLGMEQLQDTLDAAAYANNLNVAATGHPLPANKPASEQENGVSDRRA